MKCLIVDDDSFGRELLTYFLSEYAEIMDTAENGVEAVKLFTRSLQEGRPYNLVCLDILMPVMNGQEALKQMRSLERESDIPITEMSVIIMTTALNSLQEIKEAIWQGDCNNYLVKPIAQADLVSLLNKYNLI
ncbi:MAG TPA: response regulator [Dongiaceae bacterium]|nr:response regulator [Dongiaceae bacterium]